MDNLRVSELRHRLRQRGLNDKGTKRVLLRRLRAALAAANTDGDSTRPGSTHSGEECAPGSPIACQEEGPVQFQDSVSCVSSAVHSAKSGSSTSESLYVQQANAAAKRAGLEARMMLLAEKQRLTEEASAARQRELELELQREKIELKMEIVESTAREREFGKFKTNFDNHTCVNMTNDGGEFKTKIYPITTRESKHVENDTNGHNNATDAVTNGGKGGSQIVTKTELPSQYPADNGNQASLSTHQSTAVADDALAQMLRLTAKNTIPRVEIEKFDGDVLCYRSFIRAFENLICNNIQNEDEKLQYLEQYTAGQPREIVRGCLHMPAERGYKEARRLLEIRYGNQYTLAARSIDRILDWPSIKIDDIEVMDDFSIALRTCYNSMADMMSGVSELDHPKTIRKILEKLPLNIQDRWRRLADDINEQKGRIAAFEDLVDFIEREARVITNPLFGRHLFTSRGHQDARQRSGPSKRYNLAANISQADHRGQAMHCLWCRAIHPLDECIHFVNNPMEVKKEFIRNNSLCFGCLIPGHVARNCKNRSMCRECKGKHVTALHMSPSNDLDRAQRSWNTSTSEEVKNGRVNINTGKSLAPCGMAVLPVKIRSRTGRCVETYAFLDNGSSASFCTESLCEKLHIYDANYVQLKLTTVQSRGETLASKKLDGLMLSDLDENEHIPLPALYTLSYIPVSKDDIPTLHDIDRFPYLSDIDLPRINADIELMIGNNVPQAMEPWEVRRSEGNGPFAVRTKLGWVINGPIRGTSADRAHVYRTCTSVTNQQLNDALQNIYDQEFPEKNCAVDRGLSNEDRKWIEIVQNSCTVAADGHYQIALPFRHSDLRLPNNLELASRRLEGLRKRLIKDGRLREHYATAMSDLIRKGYAEKAPEFKSTSDGKRWYLPHHGVYHSQKPNKVRVVFDGAAVFRGTSLNDVLLQGPDLTNALIEVLLRFRWGPVCFTADIEAMFHQVRVPDSDRDFLRFLWWTDGDINKQPSEYRFTVHPFGATSSPACANYALRKTALDHGSNFSADATETIPYNFYVDDCLKSVETENDGIRIAQELIELCSRGGFHLTKFVSNRSALYPSLPEEDCKNKDRQMKLGQDKDHLEKALGVKWSLDSDSFGFSVAVKDRPVSKRGILAIVGSVYDPFGLISPYVLIARQLLRELCRLKIGWDEDIPKTYRKTWDLWLEDLHVLSNIAVSRCLRPQNFKDAAYQLHHFSDGSELGYGVVSYLRVANNVGNVHCGFVFGRSRLAPLKGTTIPRLELAAATLAVKMDALIQSAFRTKFNSWFWTDSTTVLRYIRNEKTRFHTFVANRLAVIRESTSPSQWRYVNSSLNPADIASRGAHGEDIIKDKSWFSGPDFLWKESHQWPSEPANLGSLSNDKEVKRNNEDNQSAIANCVNITSLKDSHPVAQLLTYYSNRWRVIRAVAWLLKVRHVLSRGKVPGNQNENLSIDEMKVGEMEIVRFEQMVTFGSELKGLTAGRPVKSSSSLRKLNPTLQNGVIVVGGRLENAILANRAKHPIILPSDSRYAKMLIQDVHEQSGHQGLHHVLALLRQSFWVIHGTKAVKRVLNGCVHCRKRFRNPEHQMMSELPPDRVQALEPPFTWTGVDCFGPFFVKRGRGQEKRYGVIFTCLAIRAVHLEIAHNLSTDSFICALKRFISRRGNVRAIRSDNGRNFVGANNELENELRKLHSSGTVYSELGKRGIEWIFNTPGASHHGGVWERMIRSTRRIFDSLLTTQSLTDETLTTFMCEAENIINSRPLTPVSMDPTDAEPLTPNHLLLLSPGGFLQTGIWHETDNVSSKRWKQARHMAEIFWKRWRTEYLPLLHSRPRNWIRKKGNLKVGDVVLLVDATVPRGQWPMGKVEKVKLSADNLVRSVTILCRGTHLTRPIQKLVKLLPDE